MNNKMRKFNKKNTKMLGALMDEEDGGPKDLKCPKCGSPLIVNIQSIRNRNYECSNKGCNYSAYLP